MDLEKLIGKTIVHKKYGNGTIVGGKYKNEDGKDKITVQFDTVQKDFNYIALFTSGGAQMIPELEDEIKADIEAAAEAIKLEEARKNQEAQKLQEMKAAEAQNSQRRRSKPGENRENGERDITVKRMESLLKGHQEPLLEIWLSRIEEAIDGRLCKSYESAESFTIKRETKEPFDRICSVYGYVPVKVCRADGSIVQKDERIDLSNTQNYYVVLERINA